MGVKGDVVSRANAGAHKQQLGIAGAGLIALVVLSAIKTQSFFNTAEKGPGGESAAGWQPTSKQNTKTFEGKAQHKSEMTPKDLIEKQPMLVRLEPFTVNLKKIDAEDHYLQAEVQLKLADEKVYEALNLRSPEIRNALLLLMSSKTREDIVTVEGKQKLASEITAQTNKIIGSKDPAKDGILGVYFTSFVIQ